MLNRVNRRVNAINPAALVIRHESSILLFRPPGPATAGRVGLYILLLYFLSFFCQNSWMRIGTSGGRRYCTNSGAVSSTHKISTDI